MAQKLDCGRHYVVNLTVTAEEWAMAERMAREQPLIGGPEGYIQAVLNTALMAEEERIDEADIAREKREGRYVEPVIEHPQDDDDWIPF